MTTPKSDARRKSRKSRKGICLSDECELSCPTRRQNSEPRLHGAMRKRAQHVRVPHGSQPKLIQPKSKSTRGERRRRVFVFDHGSHINMNHTIKDRALNRTLTDFNLELSKIYDLDEDEGGSSGSRLTPRSAVGTAPSSTRGRHTRSKSRKLASQRLLSARSPRSPGGGGSSSKPTFGFSQHSEEAADLTSSGRSVRFADSMEASSQISLIPESETTEVSSRAVFIRSDSLSSDLADESDEDRPGTTKVNEVMWADQDGGSASEGDAETRTVSVRFVVDPPPSEKKESSKVAGVDYVEIEDDELGARIRSMTIESDDSSSELDYDSRRHVMFADQPEYSDSEDQSTRNGGRSESMKKKMSLSRVGFSDEVKMVQWRNISVLNPSSRSLYVRVQSAVDGKQTVVLGDEAMTLALASEADDSGSKKKSKKGGKKGKSSDDSKESESSVVSLDKNDAAPWLLSEKYCKVAPFTSREFCCETTLDGIYLSAVVVDDVQVSVDLPGSEMKAAESSSSSDTGPPKKGGKKKKAMSDLSAVKKKGASKKGASSKSGKSKGKSKGASKSSSSSSSSSDSSKKPVPSLSSSTVTRSVISGVLLSNWYTTSSVFEFNENEMSITVCSLANLKMSDTSMLDKLLRDLPPEIVRADAKSQVSEEIADDFRIFAHMNFKKVLKSFNLDALMSKFESEGLTTVSDWRFLTESYLSGSLDVKKGHLLSFLRQRNDLFGLRMRGKATMRQLLWELDELLSLYISNPEMIDDYPLMEGHEYVLDILKVLELKFALNEEAASSWIECIKTHDLLVSSKLRIVFDIVADGDSGVSRDEYSDDDESEEEDEDGLPYLEEEDWDWCESTVSDFTDYLAHLNDASVDSDLKGNEDISSGLSEIRTMRKKIVSMFVKIEQFLQRWLQKAREVENAHGRDIQAKIEAILAVLKY